ncbi:hypothetical protein [Xanthocytophaga agilis]|uniref:Uncharacterized protein n=1 Tax=Xanthocytophaga agilis TaxID=3048010 RepID=A0AAE3QXN5_9BACT|nr:hypothetical protein [Xanthocytophaga agilis]MDJ1499926.1 hypothetical protein [Xanthocytophaga agilis]
MPHLVFLKDNLQFYLYTDYTFVGIRQDKIYWHFIKRKPDVIKVLNEIGYKVSQSHSRKTIKETSFLFYTKVHITVFDQQTQKEICVKSSTWIGALNKLLPVLSDVK